MARHEFSRAKLVEIFNRIEGLTLGDVDSKNVFSKTKYNPKITGIAGDVIEQSVLGYPPDNKQETDLVVDGVDVELKTTGLKRAKKGEYNLEAKEPMSITAVSPDKIIKEEFGNSKLWHKIENMLLVFYLYDSEKTVEASEYARFPIQGHQFHVFDGDEKEILQKDWEIVRDFIRCANDELDDPTTKYPEISKLRENMLFMDTAPKYPNPPRFRLKRSVVSAIVQKYFGKEFEPLYSNNKFCSYEELNKILHAFTEKYKNKAVSFIANDLGLKLRRNNSGIVNKAIIEQVLTAAFGAKSGKLRNIEIFAKIGIIPKTIVVSPSGSRTEDTKLDTIDFTEWTDLNISFEESSVYNYFSNQVMLFSIFKEPYADSPLENNEFLGFKRLVFSDEFIYENVKPTWDRVRRLVNNDELVVSEVQTKYGKPRVNKAGTTAEATNFPKSKDFVVFLRGTGQDSTKKTLTLNGLQMYPQQFWIRGRDLVEMLSVVEFI
jgi:DNA mismatch repair protein MutH